MRLRDGDEEPNEFTGKQGLNNFDIALHKGVPITEVKVLQFRSETFNIFNHAQFFGAAAVNNNISSAGFAETVNANSPRLVQVAAKFVS